MTRHEREQKLRELKQRLDVCHEQVIHALKNHDDDEMDRAMEQQRSILQEYAAVLKTGT